MFDKHIDDDGILPSCPGNFMPKNLRERLHRAAAGEQQEDVCAAGKNHGQDLIAVGLREGFEKFDFAIPLIVRGAETRCRRLSEAPTLMMRESCSLSVHKCIYQRLPCPAREGGFERAFIEWSQADRQILAFCALSETCHGFIRLRYMQADDMLGFYRPDFVVRTAHAIYLVETGMQRPLTDPNVQRKLKAATAWCNRVNGLDASQRSGLPWHYVLLMEDAFHEWRGRREHLSELLAFARLRPLEAFSPQGRLGY